MLEKKLLIPMSTFWKCAQGALCARAQICHLLHLKTSPITLKLISHQFAILMTQNGPLQAKIVNIVYQSVFNKKKSKN